MKQSRLMSLAESLANVLVGYGVAVVTQMVVFPLFGLAVTVTEKSSRPSRSCAATHCAGALRRCGCVSRPVLLR